MTKVTAGLKVALPGYDAQTAPDYDLSFSSNWPMEQVVKTFNYTITSADVTNGHVYFYHNLGYYAFADVWQYSADSRFTNVVAERLNSRFGYQMYFGKNSIMVPTTAIYGTLLPAGTVLSLKVYSFDFTQAFSYAAITPPVGPSTYDPHVGIKIVRPGRDINSKDLRNFMTVRTPQNTNFVSSSTYTDEIINYQIPNGIPARIDFLFSTDTTDWDSRVTGVYEASTGLAYYKNVYGQNDIQTIGDVSYTMTSSGLFTGEGLLSTVPFSVIVRRDPLLYSAPTVITI
jgi:hypothetical protein